MEFLKYLDVLIGLAVVMVLLSPMVTAVTQLAMWLRNRRSAFLLQAVERLIVQLEPQDGAVLSVSDSTGKAAAGVTVGSLGITDQAGLLRVPQSKISSSSLSLQLTSGGTPAAGHAVALARGEAAPPPLGSTANDAGVSRGHTDAAGNVTIATGALAGDVLSPATALALARTVVSHPMVARCPAHWAVVKVPPFRNRDAEVIEREEFIRILLEMAVGEQACGRPLAMPTRTKLLNLLAMNGVRDAAGRLAEIRQAAQELEVTEPNLALHVRHAKAIVASPSAFTGKITQWFDAAMARATQQYAAEARFWTAGGALIVALALQFNSFDLLQRLSSDPALREALVTEAAAQQKLIDEAAQQKNDVPAGNLEQAKAKRQEIEATLAKLRKPELAILPDHFLWQGVPEARLVRNPLWRGPYPSSFELVAGNATYTVKPRWERDPLRDIETAIRASGAPVDVTFRSGPRAVAIHATEPIDILSDRADAPPRRLVDVAQAVLQLKPADEWPQSIDPRPLVLEWEFAEGVTPKSRRVELGEISDGAVPRLKFPSILQQRFERKVLIEGKMSKVPFDVTCTSEGAAVDCALAYAYFRPNLVLTAQRSDVVNVRLRWDKDDPFSNTLNDVTRVGRVWRVAAPPTNTGRESNGPIAFLSSWLERPVAAAIVPTFYVSTPRLGHPPAVIRQLPDCNPKRRVDCALPFQTTRIAALPAKGQPRGYRLQPFTLDEIVLTSQRLGPLQLRFQAGRAETNVLDGSVRNRWTGGPRWRSEAFLGLLLSWVLLSLGAPFWFDALKNLLKLRPAAAVQEERNRSDRAATS